MAKENKELIEKLKKKAHIKTQQYLENPKKGQGNPHPFQDSTFLYIRSYDADRGQRSPTIDPPSTIFWLSPDIELYNPDGSMALGELTEGVAYRVDVTLRNDGDLNAYSCTVELYLCDPTIGYMLSAPSTHFLALQRAEVMSGDTTVVSFPFIAEGLHVGHKCMLARVHSLTHREMPSIVARLDPFYNRHDAQQNLVIAESGGIISISMASSADEGNFMSLFITAAPFNLAGNMLKTIKLLGIEPLALKEYRAFDKQFLLLPGKSEGAKFGANTPMKKLTAAVIKKYDLDLKNLPTEYVIQRETLSWNFPLVGMGAQQAFVKIPPINLKPQQAAYFHISMLENQKNVVGGISLLVVGADAGNKIPKISKDKKS